MKNLRTKVLSAVLAVSVLGASAVAFTGCGNKDTTNDSKVTLTNVSYDPTRELYESYNKIFAKHWKEETGQDVEVTQSHVRHGNKVIHQRRGFTSWEKFPLNVSHADFLMFFRLSCSSVTMSLKPRKKR